LVTAYPHYSIKAIKYEVFDYIQKPVDIDELKDTLERLKRHLSSNTTKLKEEYQMLSDREIEILKLILEGHKSEYIAKQLFISLNTVNTHRRNILKKTAAKSTFDLIRKRNKNHG
jgi:DNA-binding NarL/FixJ family response regulator